MKVYAELVAICYVTFYVYKLHGTFINHSYRRWCRRRTDIFADSNRNVVSERLERREILGRTVIKDALRNVYGHYKDIEQQLPDVRSVRVTNNVYALDDSRQTDRCVETEISLWK